MCLYWGISKARTITSLVTQVYISNVNYHVNTGLSKPNNKIYENDNRMSVYILIWIMLPCVFISLFNMEIGALVNRVDVYININHRKKRDKGRDFSAKSISKGTIRGKFFIYIYIEK